MTNDEIKAELMITRGELDAKLQKAKTAAREASEALQDAESTYQSERLRKLEASGILKSEERTRLLGGIQSAAKELADAYTHLKEIETKHKDYFQISDAGR